MKLLLFILNLLTTTIGFDQRESGNIDLSVFDISGKQVSKLLNGYFNAGEYKVEYTPDNFSSGVYFYKLNFEGQIISRKMLLIK